MVVYLVEKVYLSLILAALVQFLISRKWCCRPFWIKPSSKRCRISLFFLKGPENSNQSSMYVSQKMVTWLRSWIKLIYLFALVRFWNDTLCLCFWDQPVLSNEGILSSLMKQRTFWYVVYFTTDRFRIRSHCVTHIYTYNIILFILIIASVWLFNTVLLRGHVYTLFLGKC